MDNCFIRANVKSYVPKFVHSNTKLLMYRYFAEATQIVRTNPQIFFSGIYSNFIFNPNVISQPTNHTSLVCSEWDSWLKTSPKTTL